MRRVVFSLFLLCAAACGSDVPVFEPAVLNAPARLAFSCHGDMVLDPNAEERMTVPTAQPVSSCVRQREFSATPVPDDGMPDPLLGQRNLVVRPDFVAFALQTTEGSLAVIDGTEGLLAVRDGDALTPQKNAIPVGSLPVDVAVDPTGCYALTANSGSCDLSVLDVNSAVSSRTPAVISRRAFLRGDGMRLATRPRALAVVPQEPTTEGAMPEWPAACPAVPRSQDVVYVAMPGCHAVAGVSLETGNVVDAITFDAGGAAQVVADLNTFSCPAECDVDGSVEGMASDGPRPTTLDIVAIENAGVVERYELYIGHENDPNLTAVALNLDGTINDGVAPVQTELEGGVGVIRLKVSDEISVGNTANSNNRRFVYAIATDRTVRVVQTDLDDVITPPANPDPLRECDTQLDPRSTFVPIAPQTAPDPVTTVGGLADQSIFPCFRIGNGRRRAGARSPGIQLPNDFVPLDLAFRTIEGAPPALPGPTDMFGTFAYITASNGLVYIVNVDDDGYPDAENPAAPLERFATLSLPHQLRDEGLSRGGFIAADDSCDIPSASAVTFGPRVVEAPVQSFDSVADPSKAGQLPRGLGVECAGAGTDPVSELSFLAPQETRAAAFPDIGSILNEVWTITWEGPLFPGLSRARFRAEGGAFFLDDPAGRLCEVGTEEFDIVSLVGCSESQSTCNAGEVCFIHPESPANVGTGVCVAEAAVDTLPASCDDFFASLRQYSVQSVTAQELQLVERRRVLTTEPSAGCADASECSRHWRAERALRRAEHPFQDVLEDDEVAPTWACEADPSREGNTPRCQMTCMENTDCEAGYVCSGGFCVSGTLPTADCLGALQDYRLDGGDSFVVFGTGSGYLHNRTKLNDAAGTCGTLPDTDDEFVPLHVGRIRPQSLPACPAAPTPGELQPSPCATTVEHRETRNVYAADDAMCESPSSEVVVDPMAPAIRFENPSFVFHMVGFETQGDAVCIGDAGGATYDEMALAPFRTAYPGYQIALDIIGGYFQMAIGDDGDESNLFAARIPSSITAGPDGLLWILDQGQAANGATGTLYTANPEAASSAFAIRFVR